MGRLFILSFGVFLFILFFQPFPLEQLDFNNRLLFVTGFGALTFIISFILLILLPLIIPKWFKISAWENGPPIGLTILLLVLTVTSYAFYIRYAGRAPLSLYIMFKVILVCLIPLIIMLILYKNKSQAGVIEILQEQNRYYISKISEFEKNGAEKELEIVSDNKSDNLTLKYNNIILIKSAENYIELHYFENDKVEKKLLRSTLKSIESQLASVSNFIRCHRASLVNVLYIDKLVRSYSGYNLTLTCSEEKIPVSRQYLNQVRKAISDNR